MKFQSLITLCVLQGLTFAQWKSKNNPNGVDTYTQEEFQKIPVLRARVQDVLPLPHMSENGYLVRFLRATDWDLQAAEAKIRENFLWRHKNGLDKPVNQQFFEIWQRRQPYFHNFDRTGRPGLVTSLTGLDVRRLVSSGKVNDYNKYYFHIVERMSQLLPQISNITGKEFISYAFLYNTAGFNSREHQCAICIPFWITFMQTHDTYFPQSAFAMRIINGPRIFDTMMAVVKPFITKRGLAITTMYGVDRSEWQPAVLKIYSKDQLTFEFGGTLPKLRWNEIVLPTNSLLSPKSTVKTNATSSP